MNPGWLDQVRLIFEMLIIGCLVNFNHLRKMDKNTRWAVRFLKVRDLKSGLKGSKDKKSNKSHGEGQYFKMHTFMAATVGRWRAHIWLYFQQTPQIRQYSCSWKVWCSWAWPEEDSSRELHAEFSTLNASPPGSKAVNPVMVELTMIIIMTTSWVFTMSNYRENVN